MSSEPSYNDITLDIENEVVLAIDVKSCVLAASCLDVKSKVLYIYEDCQVNLQFEYILSMIDDLCPTTIFISSRVDELIVYHLDKQKHKFKLFIKIVPDFTKYNLDQLLISFETITNADLLINSVKKSPLLLIAMGTLNCIWTNISEYLMDTDHISQLINSITFKTFKDHMFIDVDSLYALQILPNKGVTNINDKCQKNSLFELISQFATIGVKLLKDWIRNPLTNLNDIHRRQRLVCELSKYDSRNDIVKHLKHAKNIISNYKSIQTGKLSWSKWKGLISFLQHSIELSKLLRQVEFQGVDALVSNDVWQLQQLHQFITSVIEPVSSEEEGRIKIINGVDEELDCLRTQYNNLDTILKETAKSVAENSPFEVFNCVYIPQLGFLISRIENINHEHSTTWQEVFRTPTNAYYKTSEVIQLDEQYGDIYTSITDREIEIAHQIQDHVLEYHHLIYLVADAMVELDCLCALAEVSSLPNYNFPKLTDSTDFEIVQGRHPLIETCTSLFIPNDINFQNSKVNVVTGANLSGKSVYLNQAGLITILAQIGCAVPASFATIGIVDKILTRISSRESLEKQQSTFAIDISQLSKCITLSTEKSLIIVDEFGKGTEINDSLALFGGTLKYFASLTSCPRCLFSTHFLELFKDKLFKFDTPIFNMVSTEILLQGSEKENVTYLYKVKPGVADKSFGIYCAEYCGMPITITNRAKEISNKIENCQDLALELNQLTQQEEDSFARAKEVVAKFLQIENDEDDYLAKFESIFN